MQSALITEESLCDIKTTDRPSVTLIIFSNISCSAIGSSAEDGSSSNYKKHSGVISNFQKDYIKTGIFDKAMSNIIKSAFDMRTDSDYEDFYVVPKEDVIKQVDEAEIFVNKIEEYLVTKTK